jgi:hypothetical protein
VAAHRLGRGARQDRRCRGHGGAGTRVRNRRRHTGTQLRPRSGLGRRVSLPATAPRTTGLPPTTSSSGPQIPCTRAFPTCTS